MRGNSICGEVFFMIEYFSIMAKVSLNGEPDKCRRFLIGSCKVVVFFNIFYLMSKIFIF